MKKMLYIIPAFALAFAATAAFANYDRYRSDSSEINVEVENDADIDNNTAAISNTGLNSASGMSGMIMQRSHHSRGGISMGVVATGEAVAGNDVLTQANNSTTTVDAPCSWCTRNTDIEVDVENDADVDNNTAAIANTGANRASGFGSGIAGGLVLTGRAESGNIITTVVNTSVTRVSR